jgi:hypothetical protein
MFRAVPFSNRICEEKARLRAHELHLERKEVLCTCMCSTREAQPHMSHRAVRGGVQLISKRSNEVPHPKEYPHIYQKPKQKLMEKGM